MAALLGAVALTACQAPPPGAPTVIDDPRERTVRSNDGSFVVAWRLVPEPLPLNESFGLDVRVLNESGALRDVQSVSLAVDAAMPEHGHGMNVVPTVIQVADAQFQVRGMRFHMPGRWELYFDITRGGVTERAQVEVHLE